MNKRKIFLTITAVLLTAILASSITTITVLAWPFGDVQPGDWFYNDVQWLDANNITHGCGGTNYCPDNLVTRAEMAAFLHREAGALVAAGIFVQNSSGTMSIIDWFNNVNGVAPVMAAEATFIDFDMGFTASNRFVACTVDASATATRDAFCNVSTPSGEYVRVRIFDISEGGHVPASFWLMVYGQ
jgi:hypothetical protein